MMIRIVFSGLLATMFLGCGSATTAGNASAASDAPSLDDDLDTGTSADDDVSPQIVDGKDEQEIGGDGPEPGAPLVTIQAPEEGDVFTVAESVTFRGNVAMPEEGLDGHTYRWTSDVDETLASGEVTSSVIDLEIDTLSPGEHQITLSVTGPEGVEGSAEVAILINQPPTGVTLVAISPSDPVTSDPLQASVTEAAIDPDGDPITYTYSWYVDDVMAGISGDTVPAQETSQGQVWRVEALPTDPYAAGEIGEASVTIGNTPPSLEGVSLLPSAGNTDTTFTCGLSGWSDDDGDTESVQYAWLVNGDVVPGATDATLTGEFFVKGDAVQCTVTPVDGQGAGAPVTSEIAPILDTAPAVTSATLDPPEGDQTTLFTCIPGDASDVDSDAVTLNYVWFVNDEALPGTTSHTSEAITLVKGDSLRCDIVPVADDVEGIAVSSNTVEIGNAAPAAGPVIMSPNPATELSIITCMVGQSTDPDDDNLALLYIWTVNGEVVEGQTGNTLDGAHFGKGDQVLCEAVAFDGESESPPEASKVVVMVVNTPPLVSSAEITPTTGSVQTTFTCLSGETADPDPGDTVTVSTLWYHQGVEVSGGIFEALVPAELGLSPGALTCTITPTDGDDPGPPVTSAEATIVNNPPSITSVTLGPQPATSSDTLTCTPSGWSDEDGDLESFFYEWSVAGITLADAHDPTLSPEHFDKGDLIVCVVTPTDGMVLGTAMPSNSLVIANSPPSVTGATISPTVGGKMTPFVCDAQGASDPDASDIDTLLFAYTWSIDGDVIVGAESKTFTPGGDVSTDASLTCTVRPYDLQHYGDPAGSGPALITNLAPSIESVIITVGDEGLYCVPQGASDPDGDDVTYDYTWLLNGLIVEEEEEAFLASDDLVKDDEVRCVITPTDGTADGQPVTSEPYLFSNDGPTTPVVTLEPEDAAPGEPLECDAVATDPDDDQLTYTYTWALDGEVLNAYTQATLPAGVTEACETWACTAVASDGQAESPVGSDTLTLGPEDGGDPGGYLWHGHHSAPSDATSGDVASKNTFFSTERVATRITPALDAFPMTLTHVRFYGTGGTYFIEVFADGAEPAITLASTTHVVSSPGMQVVPLDAPTQLNGAMSVWVAINGEADYWVASNDKDGQSISNLIYGCPTFIPTLGCIDWLGGGGEVPFEWYPFSTFDGLFDTSWSTWGDPIIDVGYAGDVAPPTCD
jgi:hypothetical protein